MNQVPTAPTKYEDALPVSTVHDTVERQLNNSLYIIFLYVLVNNQ